MAGVEGPRVKQVKSAIAVYAVDSMADALFLQRTVCLLRYDGSFAYSEGLGLGDDGRRVLELDDLEGITEQLHELYTRHLAHKQEVPGDPGPAQRN